MSDRVSGTQEFFGSRAAGWDERFPDDGPAFRAAVREAGFASSSVVADIGCGTGRALPYLRDAIGPDGVLLAVDVTAEMLATARPRATAARAGLLKADALRLPLLEGSVAGVFAAGLVPHLADPAAGWPSWRGSPCPAAAWCCSTRSAGPPSPGATAAPCPRTTRSPPTPWSGRSPLPDGGPWPTTTPSTGSWWWPSGWRSRRASAGSS
jgi:SAM-dependent methyltransferase